MKPENKQRFSIRKYAIGAASVLIGFAFQAQAVAADGVVPAPTENQPAVQTTGEVTPPTSEEKLETAPTTENATPAAPVATTSTSALLISVCKSAKSFTTTLNFPATCSAFSRVRLIRVICLF